MITRQSSNVTLTTHSDKGATVGFGVSVVPQLGMGLGLVACRAFEKNELITQYEGVIISRKVADAPNFNASHVYSFGKLCIDGYKDREEAKGFGGASFVNHGGHKANARYDHDNMGNVFVVATQTIHKGEFIMTDYGTSYIQKKGLFTPVDE
jgi:hypothetical protein